MKSSDLDKQLEIYNRGNKWQIENWESTHN